MKLYKKIDLSKEYRKNGEKSERMVWKYILKNNKYHWIKQKIINGYIVDFYCDALKLVIEVDGETHDTDEEVIYDNNRTEILEKSGYKIIRLRNEEVQAMIWSVKEYAERLFEERYAELYVN